MKPIVLIRQHDSGRLEAVWINPEHIAYFATDNTRTRVVLDSEAALWVKESPEQVASILERSRAALRAEERDGVSV